MALPPGFDPVGNLIRKEDRRAAPLPGAPTLGARPAMPLGRGLHVPPTGGLGGLAPRPPLGRPTTTVPLGGSAPLGNMHQQQFHNRLNQRQVTFGGQPAFGARPMGSTLGARPLGSNFGSRPMGSTFGAQPTLGARPMGSTFGAQPTFGSRPLGSTFGSRPLGSTFGSQPTFGSRPLGSTFGTRPFGSPFGQQTPFGPPKPNVFDKRRKGRKSKKKKSKGGMPDPLNFDDDDDDDSEDSYDSDDSYESDFSEDSYNSELDSEDDLEELRQRDFDKQMRNRSRHRRHRRGRKRNSVEDEADRALHSEIDNVLMQLGNFSREKLDKMSLREKRMQANIENRLLKEKARGIVINEGIRVASDVLIHFVKMAGGRTKHFKKHLDDAIESGEFSGLTKIQGIQTLLDNSYIDHPLFYVAALLRRIYKNACDEEVSEETQGSAENDRIARVNRKQQIQRMQRVSALGRRKATRTAPIRSTMEEAYNEKQKELVRSRSVVETQETQEAQEIQEAREAREAMKADVSPTLPTVNEKKTVDDDGIETIDPSRRRRGMKKRVKPFVSKNISDGLKNGVGNMAKMMGGVGRVMNAQQQYNTIKNAKQIVVK